LVQLLTNSLLLRIISGLVLGFGVAFSLIYGHWAFWVIIGGFFLIALYEWISLSMKGGKEALLLGITGTAYLLFCFAAFFFLYFHFDYGAYYILILFTCIWATDTGAYFTGKLLDGPKMAPYISPKKTWSGLIGGIVSSIIVIFVWEYYTLPLSTFFAKDWAFPFDGLIMPALTALAIALAGQGGDLLISAAKRKVRIKDTGDIIPGHGGVLDRIDSLLLATPVFILCLWGFAA